MQGTKATTRMAKNTELAHLDGQTTLLILENSLITIFMAKVCIIGQIHVNMRANGEPIKCMEKGLLIGQMEENMSENTLRIRKKAMENSCGQTAGVTGASGSTVSSMEKGRM